MKKRSNLYFNRIIKYLAAPGGYLGKNSEFEKSHFIGESKVRTFYETPGNELILSSDFIIPFKGKNLDKFLERLKIMKKHHS